MEVNSISKTSGAPTARSMVTSLVLHVLVVGLLMLIPAQVLLRSEAPNRELDIVFYRPPEIAVKPAAVPVAMPKTASSDAGSPPGAPAPARKPKPNATAGPDLPNKSAELPPGPAVGFPVEPKPEPKAGKAGILAFKDKFASM